MSHDPLLNHTSPDNASARQSLRRQIRRRRQALSPIQQRHAALAVKRQLIRLPVFRNADRIACYLANDGEVDMQAVISRIQAMDKQCYLPVLDPLGSNRLWFAPLLPGMPMRANRFGIPEPDISARHFIAAWQLDLLLLPLVAFDPAGNRLGMGGGFYDRSLAYLHRQQRWRKPHLFGIAHQFQCVPALQQATWDIPLHGIITDQTIYRVA